MSVNYNGTCRRPDRPTLSFPDKRRIQDRSVKIAGRTPVNPVVHRRHENRLGRGEKCADEEYQQNARYNTQRDADGGKQIGEKYGSRKSQEIEVFPNPVHDLLRVNIPASVQLTALEVVDLLGKPVLRLEKPSGLVSIPTGSFASGIYALKFFDSMADKSEIKISVQH